MSLQNTFSSIGKGWRGWLRRTPNEWRWAFHRRFQPDRPFRVPFDGDLKLQVRLRDELGFVYALQRDFEPDVCAFFRRFLKPGMIVLDLGGNVGHYSLMAAKRVGPTGAVHAFEPADPEFRELCANVALNGFENVIANQSAICDRVGEVTLQRCAGGLGLYNSIGAPLREAEVISVNVACTTLDAYVRSARLSRVDLIKMDIEGAELAALRGADALLARADAPIIVCEFSDPAAAGMGHSTGALRQALERFGYRLYRYELKAQRLVPEIPRDWYQYDNLIACKTEPDL